MPELPEVETIKRQLSSCLNLEVIDVEVGRFGLRKPFTSTFVADLLSAKIVSVERVGKYLFFNLNSGKCILMHAGMSGRFDLKTAPLTKGRHDHLVITFANQQVLIFNDPRRFGLALTFGSKEEALKYARLGLDPINDQLQAEQLLELFKKRNSNIKDVLMNQQILAGIGNIYASEILCAAGIHPESAANKIPLEQLRELAKQIRLVLQKAIKLGGSTWRDYRTPEGQKGAFQETFTAYTKEGERCHFCSGKICKITQSNRATYYCEQHQLHFR